MRNLDNIENGEKKNGENSFHSSTVIATHSSCQLETKLMINIIDIMTPTFSISSFIEIKQEIFSCDSFSFTFCSSSSFSSSTEPFSILVSWALQSLKNLEKRHYYLYFIDIILINQMHFTHLTLILIFIL